MKGDPKITTAKFSSKCDKCGTKLQTGDSIVYFPKSKTVFCRKCGYPEIAHFRLSVEDETFLQSQYYK